MTEATKRPWYVGAQNDALFIIAGRPPSKSNDYPVHDADRTVIAKIYNVGSEDANAALIVRAVNHFDALVAVCKEVVEEDGFRGSGLMRKRIDDMRAVLKAITDEEKDGR